jgi:hypothetical protein
VSKQCVNSVATAYKQSVKLCFFAKKQCENSVFHVHSVFYGVTTMCKLPETMCFLPKQCVLIVFPQYVFCVLENIGRLLTNEATEVK